MRSDMKRLLVTRPRAGGGNQGTRKIRRNKNYDDLPSKQSPRRAHINMSGQKNLNEYLAPLRRYIEKQIGKNWDGVFSEMSKYINASDPIQRHILEHVEDFISINVVPAVSINESETGWVHHDSLVSNGYRNRRPVRPGTLYVDPNTRIVRRAKTLVKKSKTPANPAHVKQINANLWYVKISGVWYAIGVTRFVRSWKWKWFDHTPEENRNTSYMRWPHGHYTAMYNMGRTSTDKLPEGVSVSRQFLVVLRSLKNKLIDELWVATSKRQLTREELRAENIKNNN